MSLRAALHSFCKRKTIEKYRKACLRNTGPAIIMSDNILDRIVDCAHAYVISTLDQLAKETYWGCVEELGEEVLQMILNMCPKPTPHINPLGPIQTGNQPALKPITIHHCRACGETGHISVLII